MVGNVILSGEFEKIVPLDDLSTPQTDNPSHEFYPDNDSK